MDFFKNRFLELEKSVIKIMIFGIKFSIFICTISAIILFIYINFYTYPSLYYIGLKLFKTGSLFISYFIICGIASDTIKKDLIK